MTSMGCEKMTEITIGVDISKDRLDVHCWPDGAAREFTNDLSGYRALIRWLAGREIARIVFEPTGPFHRQFERALAAAGLPLAKVNPRHARRFADALGLLAKTDRLDAGLLARMGALLEPRLQAPASAVLDELRELHLARAALIKDRVAARNRAGQLRLPLLRRQNARRLARIERDLAAVDAAIAALIGADPALARKHRILTSIPGISAITAAAILAEMPELGTLGPKQAASLAGLAPSPGSPELGAAEPASAADARPSGAPSTCPRSPPPATIPTSRRNTPPSEPPGSPSSSPSPPSCASSCSSPTHCSATTARGAQTPPDPITDTR